MTPDIEAIVGTYLRSRAPVAAIVGDRVGGRTPRSTADPWVRVTLLDDIPRSRALHFVEAPVQLDCYGGEDETTAQEEASQLARTVREALHDMADHDHDNAVVTAVKFGSMPRVPDPDLTPPRERYVLQATVYAHA